MKLKELVHWTEHTGISTPPWVNKDWQSVLHLMSKILADDLVQRRHADEVNDVTFKISFNAMLQIAEDVLGIPRVVVDEDLQQPNIHLALLTYMICVQHSLPHLDPKAIRDTPPPKLVFEAHINASSLPTCPGCSQHAFFVERIIIGHQVWHRRCFKCHKCGRLLHRGSYRCVPDMSPPAYECVEHLPMKVLKGSGENPTKEATDPQKEPIEATSEAKETPQKPVPMPKPKNLVLNKPTEHEVGKKPEVKKESSYEELDATNPFADTEDEGAKTNRSSSVDSDIVAKLAEASMNIDSPKHETKAPSTPSSVKTRAPPPRPPPPSADRVSVIIQKSIDMPSTPTTTTAPTHRVSVIIENKEEEKTPKNLQEPLQIKTESSPANTPVPKPRTHVVTAKDTLPQNSPAQPKEWEIVNYPGFLNPFGEDDEDDEDSSDDEYDDSLNPFADETSATSASSAQPSPAPRHDPVSQKPMPSPRSVSSMSSTSASNISNDRPKVQPPPPPKPPRPSLAPRFKEESKTSRILTLPRAKKSYRAPPPPIPIEFTENKKYDSIQSILGELRILEEEHERLEITGRSIEKDILFTLERNAMEWKKNKKLEDFLAVIEHKCDVIRKESVLVHLWLEHFLNEIHSDTEYQLRCLLEACEGKERTQTDVKREAELLEVLVDIMGLKNGMIESKVDPASIIDGSASKPKQKDASAMKKMKTRLKKLKKKL